MIWSFLGGLWGKIAAVGAIVLAVLVLVGKLMAAGRDKERAAVAKREFELRRKGDEVDRTIDAASDSELERLRNKWTRPK